MEPSSKAQVAAVWAIWSIIMAGGVYVVYHLMMILPVSMTEWYFVPLTILVGGAGFFFGAGAFIAAVHLVFWREIYRGK